MNKIYDSLIVLKDYLFYIAYSNLDYDFAKMYYLKSADKIQYAKACSAVRNGNWYGRNLDWTYSENAEFVVVTRGDENRFSTIGIAGGLSALTNDIVKKGMYKDRYMEMDDSYKVLPFNLYDGINEMGLVCNTNVVPLEKPNIPSVPKIERLESISGVMLVRYILDNFATALAAIHYIQNYVSVYFPKVLHEMGYECHYMLADDSGTYILEFIDGEAVYKNVSDEPYMTNFLVTGIKTNSDGTVYTPETQDELYDAIKTNHITPHGSGLERWNYIVEHYDSAYSEDNMKKLMRDLFYTRAYVSNPNYAEPYWYTEFVGGELTCASNVSDFIDIVLKAGEAYKKASRKAGKTWFTAHSVVYDMQNRYLSVCSQEDGMYFKFTLK